MVLCFWFIIIAFAVEHVSLLFFLCCFSISRISFCWPRLQIYILCISVCVCVFANVFLPQCISSTWKSQPTAKVLWYIMPIRHSISNIHNLFCRNNKVNIHALRITIHKNTKENKRRNSRIS